MFCRLICDPGLRLGHEQRGGASGIKEHSFFHGLDFDNLRQNKAPFVPELKSITDTSYFPLDELEHIQKDLPSDDKRIANTTAEDPLAQKKDLAFVGYTFKKFDYLTRKNAI